MSVYFSGTSTGNFYEVGREYTNSRGGTSVANRDGSFTDTKTGQRSVGSSQDGSTSWYATSDEKMAQKGTAAQAEWLSSKGGDEWAESKGITNQVMRGEAVTAGSPKGESRAVPTIEGTVLSGGRPGPTVERALALQRGAGTGSIFRGPVLGNPKDVTNQVLFGYDFRGNPRITDAALAEDRYAEIGANLLGIGILGLDLGYNAARATFGPNVDSMGPKERAAELSRRADGVARDAGPIALGGLMTAWDAANNWGRNQQLIEEARQRAIAISNDSWDAREELQAQEWNRLQPKEASGGGW